MNTEITVKDDLLRIRVDNQRSRELMTATLALSGYWIRSVYAPIEKIGCVDKDRWYLEIKLTKEGV